MRNLGDSPSDGVSFGRGIRRVLAAAKSAFKNSVRAQIEECHLATYFAIHDFRKALEVDLPDPVRQLVERQLTRLRDDLEALRELREGETSSPGGAEEPTSRGRLDCAGLTHIGRVREVNEDHFLIAELRKWMLVHQTSLDLADRSTALGDSHGHLLVVADGMGERPAGHEASAVAIESLRQHVLDAFPWLLHIDGSTEETRLLQALKEAFHCCQDRIRNSEQEEAARHGMGTTLTLAYVLWPKVFVVHAGDSRCYLQRNDRLERLTTDHTIGQRLVDLGELDEAQAQASGQNQVLWNVLGGGDDALESEVHSADLRFGDTLCLCSDGLTGHVSEARMLEILRNTDGAEEGAEQLLAAALDGGGKDNVTVIVGRFEEAGVDADDP